MVIPMTEDIFFLFVGIKAIIFSRFSPIMSFTSFLDHVFDKQVPTFKIVGRIVFFEHLINFIRCITYIYKILVINKVLTKINSIKAAFLHKNLELYTFLIISNLLRFVFFLSSLLFLYQILNSFLTSSHYTKVIAG